MRNVQLQFCTCSVYHVYMQCIKTTKRKGLLDPDFRFPQLMQLVQLGLRIKMSSTAALSGTRLSFAQWAQRPSAGPEMEICSYWNTICEAKC